VSKHRDFIFGVHVDRSYIQADGRQTVPERGVVTSRDTFEIWGPHPYLRKGWS